jgi:hypothetical protein
MMFHLNILVMKHALILLFGLLASSQLQAQEALVQPMPRCESTEIATVTIPITQQQTSVQQQYFIGCSCCRRPAVQKPLPLRPQPLAICSHGVGEAHQLSCYEILPCGHTPIQHRYIDCGLRQAAVGEAESPDLPASDLAVVRFR